MELKRRSHFNLLKKLTAFLICFCLLMFILFNYMYMCNDSQCYWIANRYSYAQGRFFGKQANQTATGRPYGPASSAPFGEESQRLKASDRSKGRQNSELVKATNSTDQLGRLGSPNKSDQLISSKRKGRIVNLPEQLGESGSRFKYLNLINHPSTNRSLLYLNRVTYDQLVNSNDRKYHIDFQQDDVLIFLHIQKTGGTAFGKRLVGDLQLSKPCECFKDKKHCSCIRPSWKDDLDASDQLKLADEREAGKNSTVNGDEGMKISSKLVDSTINGSRLVSPVRINRPSNLGKPESKARSKYWLFSRYSTGWICGLHADWTQLNYCADDALNRIEKVKLKRRFFFITILRDPVSR